LDSGLALGSSLIIHILLSYGAKPGLRWKVDSEFVQHWSAEEWFPHLIKQIRSTTVHQYVYQFYAYEFAEREDEIVVDKSTPDAPYLEVTVPTRFEDVRGIVFHFISHDQGNTPWLDFYGITLVLTFHCIGWSDQKAKWGGGYVDSSTFFEVGCKNIEARQHICFNVHASSKWHTNRQIWDVRNPAKREWLLALKPGDVIQVFAKARYPGWENHVRHMKIELFGNESVE
jgi:hypothetical protein